MGRKCIILIQSLSKIFLFVYFNNAFADNATFYILNLYKKIKKKQSLKMQREA